MTLQVPSFDVFFSKKTRTLVPLSEVGQRSGPLSLIIIKEVLLQVVSFWLMKL